MVDFDRVPTPVPWYDRLETSVPNAWAALGRYVNWKTVVYEASGGIGLIVALCIVTWVPWLPFGGYSESYILDIAFFVPAGIEIGRWQKGRENE